MKTYRFYFSVKGAIREDSVQAYWLVSAIRELKTRYAGTLDILSFDYL